MNDQWLNNRKRGANFNRGFTIPKKQFRENDWHNQNDMQFQHGENDWQNQNDMQFQQFEHANEPYNDYQPNFRPRGPPRGFSEPNNFRNHHQYQNDEDFPVPDDSGPFQPHFNANQQQFRKHFPYNQRKLQNDYKETPKTGDTNTGKYKDSFPHLSDPSLPKELVEQFQPLYCKLCAAQLSSNVMAKLHYKSKNHEKKVRKFLIEYSERTGEPLHELAKTVSSKKQKQEEDNDPKFFRCDVCDLQLTGRLHAESHYMGKNHQRALVGKTPAGRGHYDQTGNWIRTSPAVPSDRDTFGEDFATSQAQEVAAAKEPKTKTLQCEVCNVSVTSDQQLVMHMNGQKHKKKVEQQSKEKEDENKVEVKPDDSILSSLSCSSIPSADLSVYRTPTGYYYCNPCNMSLNSETQFKQHLGSKKHRKKASISKEPTASV